MTTTAPQTGKQKLRAAVRDMPGASTAELALAAGIGRPTASSLLNKWLTDGKVRQEKTGRTVAWFDIDADVTAPEPAAERFTAEDVDAALDQLQAELTANAPAIAAIMDAPLPGEQAPQGWAAIEGGGEDLSGVSAAVPAADAGDADRPGVRAEDEATPTADVTPAVENAPICRCGGDEVGHVHPEPKAAAKTKGSVDKAREAALAALAKAGVDGVNVRALWTIMETEGGIVWVGAYRLLNRMRRENGVIVTGEHKAENRTARLAPR